LLLPAAARCGHEDAIGRGHQPASERDPLGLVRIEHVVVRPAADDGGSKDVKKIVDSYLAEKDKEKKAKEDAEKAKAALEGAGASVELK